VQHARRALVLSASAASNPSDKESLVKSDVGDPASKISTATGSQVQWPHSFCGICIDLSFPRWYCTAAWMVSDQKGCKLQAAETDVKSLQDLPSYPRAFVTRRLIVFVGIVIGWGL
jgi:hypothetical protein